MLVLETNYKVITRWYLVPARIAKILPSYPSNCFRGCTDLGTHGIWWTCSTVSSYWSEAFGMLCFIERPPLTSSRHTVTE